MCWNISLDCCYVSTHLLEVFESLLHCFFLVFHCLSKVIYCNSVVQIVAMLKKHWFRFHNSFEFRISLGLMGITRSKDERHGIHHHGPQEKAWITEQHEWLARRWQINVLRQRACRERKWTNFAAAQQSSLVRAKKKGIRLHYCT